jgi:outer membrane protein
MKDKIRVLVTTALMLCLLHAGALFAQEKRSLTLQEAIDLSIKSSGQLKGSQAKIEEALGALREANERKLPDANVSASHIRLNSPNVDVKVKSNNNNGGTSEPAGKVTSATYGIMNVTLPIYSGLRIRYGIESARYLAEAARLDAANDKEGVILNTINAYDNLYKSRAAVDLVKENLGSAQERVKQFTNLEKNGLLARNDLLKAELQASNIELSLLDAESNWKLANIAMDLMLGLPETTELVPNEASLQNTAELKPIEDYVQQALQNRKDRAALALRQKAAATGVKAVKGEMYPSIALTGGYIGAYVPNLLTVYNAANIGVGVQYSLSSLWKNKSKVQQAEARQKQIEANEGLLTDNIHLQVNQAYQGFLLSQKKIEVYQKAVTQAEENYKIVRNKYENALANTTDLLDADVAQLQAKLNYAFSKSDALVAYNKLLQTAGLLNAQSENK